MANFKQKRTTATSRGFLAIARLSCYYYYFRFTDFHRFTLHANATATGCQAHYTVCR